MVRRCCLSVFILYLSCGIAGAVGTFGKVVPIGGAAADLALDEPRGYLYIANFTANRIEQMSLADYSIRSSINVPAQPSSLALSPDGRYLVVAHYGNFASPGSPANALTVVDLSTAGKQTFALGNPPLGVAFGVDGRALVVTSQEFILFEPVTGVTQILDTVSGVQAKTLPATQAGPAFPPQIIAASIGVSGDGGKMYGLTDKFMFSYDVNLGLLNVIGYVSTPAQGPRVVSVNRDGSYYTSGWTLNDRFGNLIAEFLNPTGALNTGGHVIDSSRNVIYAQIPDSTAGSNPPPVLQIVDADNLNVRERLKLPENLAGRGLLSSDSNTMYAISDSGVLVLPVGSLYRVPRLTAGQEDVVFRGNFCDRRVTSQQVVITDPGGGNTPFSISSATNGVTVSPSFGTTPATVRISVDPNAFQNRGTTTAAVTLSSPTAVNIPQAIRVLINTKEPDQRGTFVDVPGKLADLLADPVRDRFYILRQDTNQVLVFDGSNNTQIATLRTSNVPTQMAITFDQRYLLIGSNDSQIIPVFDLETLKALPPVIMPGGHYPRSVAASAKAILAASRVSGPAHTIDRVDIGSRTATQLPTLGIFKNDINVNTVLVASPNGSSIFGASADGTVLLYNANADAFTVMRKDFTSLSGAYAASNFDQYMVGNNILNSSLVSTAKLETSSGQSSGFAFVDQTGFRTTAVDATSPGVIQRVDTTTGTGIRATRTAEAPLLGTAATYPFTRTVAALYSRNSIIVLTTSGFTVLPWTYDDSVAPPKITSIVNAADLNPAVAPGSLVSIFGTNMSPVSVATKEIPLPTALADSCLTVNGLPVPLIFASPGQINAQLPYQTTGNVMLVLRTPGGVSDNYNLTIQSGAPGVFRVPVDGYDTLTPTIIRAENQAIVTTSNPVHRGDVLSVFLTGLGQTSPPLDAGVPAPLDQLTTTVVPPRVDLGGLSLPVSFAGLMPGQVGVYQINVSVPRNAPTGISVPLRITQGTATTSLAVRVVE